MYQSISDMEKKIQGDKVIWGIIGAGDVCEKKSAPAMYKLPNSSVKSVMRRSADKAEDFAERHQIPFWFTNANYIFNDPEINAIYIATPPESHAELTIKAAQAGKAVYVEKPMARSFEECNAMIYECKNAGVPLFVAYYRRALPKFIKLKELIESKVIGDIRLVQIEMIKPLVPDINAKLVNNWRIDPNISGGGYFYDVACHQLDILDFIFGPLNHVSGICTNQGNLYSAEDIVTGVFSMSSKIMGVGSWCFTASGSNEKEITSIIGSKGKIEFSTFGDSPIFVDSEIHGKTKYNFQSPQHIEEPMIRTVVDDLLGKAICPCDGATGSRTNLVMEKMCHPLSS